MTVNSAALSGILFLEDTFPVIRRLDSESVDLIATGPPFDKGERIRGNHQGWGQHRVQGCLEVWRALAGEYRCRAA